ncbi:expressed unknown protein [Seminavis robusta]|uniref:Uncharacterized protein n=1 Tax=Seminavis robusta TaxID=568900 RepID=A0A9N8HQS7_9STRA|nr:expressed unknown protein [Seminavis robusta]|eukprot:Sro1012_g231250.1 n/a (271) ;mRNA; r:33388-34292
MFASNHHQVFRQMNHNNNEDTSAGPMKHNGEFKNSASSFGAVSKTPAASSKQRRALGDISNRNRGGIDQSAGPKKSTGLRLQQQQQQPQRNALSVIKTPGLSKKKEVAFLPRPSQAKLAPSNVTILPDLGNSKTPKSMGQLHKKSASKSKAKVTFHEPVEEIEKSAGRLWIDEPADDDSYSSISIPGIATLRQDYKATAKRGRAIRLKKQQEEAERDDLALEQYIEEVFASDEQAMIGADVWIERTHSFDDDLDDDLSFSAPSFCGDISF